MKTVFIHYFTGTGNTAHAVSVISNKLRLNEYKVEVIPVSKNGTPPSSSPDFHIIAFPVLSWAAPALMKKYIASFPSAGKIPVAILAIQGAVISHNQLVKGYAGQALEEIERMLKHKNYNVFLSSSASYPDNWTQATNPCKPEEVDSIFKSGDTEVEQFISDFLMGETNLFRCGFSNKLWSFPIAILFGKIGQRIMGTFFIADEKCTACQICVKSCPVNTIYMKNGKPWWGSHCEDCNRCINICPEKAIQVSVPLSLIQIVSNIGLTIWAISSILKYTPQWVSLKPISLVLLEILLIIAATLFLFWVAIVPFNKFFSFLMKSKRIRKFFSMSYTSSFRRYTAPGFKPLSRS